MADTTTGPIVGSDFFKLNWRDIGKGLIVTVLSAVLTIVFQTLSEGSLQFDWETIKTVAIAAGGAYLMKQLFGGASVFGGSEVIVKGLSSTQRAELKSGIKQLKLVDKKAA